LLKINNDRKDLPNRVSLSPMFKVLIADDHEIVRKGIRQIILEEFSFADIAEACDTDSLVEAALEGDWDIIISDLAMPGGGGIEALTRIREQKPVQRILIVSIYPEEQYALRVMKSGASGFLNKNTAPEELIEAINIITSGRRYIQPSLSEKMANLLQTQAGVFPHELLSDREFDVLLKLAKGMTVSDIANELSLTVNTISTYRSRILEKMHMKSNADIIRYVMENNLL
jgi:two-component system, NarL family, invasion response regulator UvrY